MYRPVYIRSGAGGEYRAGSSVLGRQRQCRHAVLGPPTSPECSARTTVCSDCSAVELCELLSHAAGCAGHNRGVRSLSSVPAEACGNVAMWQFSTADLNTTTSASHHPAHNPVSGHHHRHHHHPNHPRRACHRPYRHRPTLSSARHVAHHPASDAAAPWRRYYNRRCMVIPPCQRLVVAGW